MKINNQSLTDGGRRSFEAIDLMKFICAILVVAIHISPFGQNVDPRFFWPSNLIKNYLARIAVPFFFMCTGFLLFRRVDLQNFTLRQTSNYIKKTFRLYLLWVLIYCGPIIEYIVTNPRGVVYAAVIFLRNLIFTGGYVHLWYLNALGFAVLLISLLLHLQVRFSRILGASFVLYLLGLLLLPYFGVIKPLQAYPIVEKALRLFDMTIVTPRNGLFFGFFYISLGALFACKPICMSMRRAVSGFIVSMLLMLAEVLWLAHTNWARGYDFFLFLAPASFFLFYIVTHIELKTRGIYRYLRTSSTLVFFNHYLVYRIFEKVFACMDAGIENTCLPFLLTLACSILVSHVIIRLSARPGCAWLKRLYS